MPDIKPCAFPAVAAVSPSALAVKVREIVARDPHFVYKTPPVAEPFTSEYCRYAYKGEPSCLIGRGLYELGVPIEELDALDEGSHGEATIYSAAYAIAIGRHHDEVLRDLNVRWLDRMQNDQDNGVPYGLALHSADRLAEGGLVDEELDGEEG